MGRRDFAVISWPGSREGRAWSAWLQVNLIAHGGEPGRAAVLGLSPAGWALTRLLSLHQTRFVPSPLSSNTCASQGRSFPDFSLTRDLISVCSWAIAWTLAWGLKPTTNRIGPLHLFPHLVSLCRTPLPPPHTLPPATPGYLPCKHTLLFLPSLFCWLKSYLF